MASVLFLALLVKFHVMDGVRHFRTISKIVVSVDTIAMRVNNV